MWPTALGLVAALYLAAVSYLALAQRRFIYRPPPVPLDSAALRDTGHAPLDAPPTGLPRLWFAPARDIDGRVVVFLHGNASTVSDSLGKLAPLREAGHGVLLIEYPGFGGTSGAPSEATLAAAADGGMAALAEHGIAAARCVLWGESLGTGLATRLAMTWPVGGVILEAPFTSVADRAQEIYWWTPARWLVRDRFDNLARIGALGAPLLIAHGARDSVTPIAHGRALLAAAAAPKRGVFLPEAGHVDLDQHGMMPEILRFLATLPETAAR